MRGEFQFTPPCGGGGFRIVSSFLYLVISIHAPVWGRAY